MSLPPNWQRYTTDEGKEYFHNAATNVTQWDRPAWPEGSNSLGSLNMGSAGSADVFQYKPTAAELEVPSMRPANQALDDVFMGQASGTSELVSLKEAVPSGKIGSDSAATAAASHSNVASGGLSGFAAGFAAGAAAAAAGGAAGSDADAGYGGWLLATAQSLFDVSTDDIVRRLKLVLPYPPPDSKTAEELRTRPDFYGPFWVATTAVLFLAATGNFARLVESEHPSKFKADYGLVPIAATMIYGGLVAVPVIARLSLLFTGEEVATVDFKQMVCVCGYAMSPAIPASILCIVPVGFLRWLFVMAGLALSLHFLRRNFLVDISVKARSLQMTLVVSPILLQVMIFCVYRIHFFAGVRA
eukprot:TRINITY_DN51738_c0_g1_i1.p1 TRINITY_DN51738_c0_g1~~TRINITY_DN51738_c0_g1_i1.p1  ORF type:complete len:358 (-),score=74.96 TRINITY_DN51738_c0_g1_i1:49-1122(-)